MYCHQCGKSLSVESKFCNVCGIDLTGNRNTLNKPHSPTFKIPFQGKTNAMTSIQDAEENEVIFRVRPSLYSVLNAYLGAAGFSILGTAIVGYFGLPLFFLLLILLFLFAVPFFRHLRRNYMSYTLTASNIKLESGLLSKTVKNIPLRSAQNVTINATLLERLIKIGDIVIDSAAEGGEIRLRQIPHPRKYANLILQQLQYRP